MIVAGVGPDCLINLCWLLCGVVPGHIHGFYITWTYFSRRRKVANGRYPGAPNKSFIYSRRVLNGDASDERVRQLWEAEQRAREEKLRRASGRRTSWRSAFGNGGGSKKDGAEVRLARRASTRRASNGHDLR